MPVINDEAVWELEVRRADDYTLLSAVGELDLDTAPRLMAEVNRQLRDGVTALVIDIEQLTFVDSSGLGTLVGCWRRAQQAGASLVIANPTTDVLLTLEITGLDQILPLERGGDLTVPSDAA